MSPVNDELLSAAIDAELARPVAPPVTALAQQLAARGGGHTLAVLFYGSALRGAELDGVLDFYIVLERLSAWHGSGLAALANKMLPPNVGYFAGELAGAQLRAKYAVVSLVQFQHGMSPAVFDTTLWARFSQPCVCAWSRSPADRAAIARAVEAAVVTGARWAALLGPHTGSPLEFWQSLYARTYAAELRVERSGRSSDLVERDAARFSDLLIPAWRRGGIEHGVASDGRLAPRLKATQRRRAARRWEMRRRLGKPLNVLRLLKAAFTFEGGLDYVLWKVERHSGQRIELAPWQRRFPLLAAPGLYLKLRRLGVLR